MNLFFRMLQAVAKKNLFFLFYERKEKKNKMRNNVFLKINLPKEKASSKWIEHIILKQLAFWNWKKIHKTNGKPIKECITHFITAMGKLF